MSLVCVDEKKLLGDIERLLKRDLPRVVIQGYEPDPSIRAEPIKKRNNTRPGNQAKPRNQRPGQTNSQNKRPGQGRTRNRRQGQAARRA